VVTEVLEVTTVGVRELKARLSEYLALARSGEVVTVTDRGEPVAQLSAIPISAEERVRELVSAGLAEWGGEPLQDRQPVGNAAPGTSVSDLVSTERDEAAARFAS
jgi:prevent-host-death family protein